MQCLNQLSEDLMKSNQVSRNKHSQSKRKFKNHPKPEKSHKHLFLTLWQDWLYEVRYLSQDKPWPALDRWLKNWFRQQERLPLELQSELSAACYDIFRVLQKIDFLETSYQAKNIISEVVKWDLSWHCQEVENHSARDFVAWFGILFPEHNFASQLTCEARQTWYSSEFKPKWRGQADAESIQVILNSFRPTWLPLLVQRQLISNWDDGKLIDFIKSQETTPPLWLRADPKLYNELKTSLYKQGVKVALDDNGLMAVGGKGVNQTQEYKQGLIEIQDYASQQIAAAVMVKPGQKVWDACAGAGGKSLAIASKMNNKGSLVATDLQSYKLDELKKRAKRAQLHNVRAFAWDGESALRLPNDVAKQKGFDWVLVDAPCSSAGTWRRNPDAKWRFNQSDTDELVKIQSGILDNAAKAVRKGGYLVYATCSWQVAENEAQVADFIANNPGFELVEQKMLGAPDVDSDIMFVATLKLKQD